MEEQDHSCWTCDFQRKGGHTTFLGRCAAPSRNNPERNKEIPGEIVDKGCGKFWTERKQREPEPELELGE